MASKPRSGDITITLAAATTTQAGQRAEQQRAWLGDSACGAVVPQLSVTAP
jgi:hypothetical protein